MGNLEERHFEITNKEVAQFPTLKPFRDFQKCGTMEFWG